MGYYNKRERLTATEALKSSLAALRVQSEYINSQLEEAEKKLLKLEEDKVRESTLDSLKDAFKDTPFPQSFFYYSSSKKQWIIKLCREDTLVSQGSLCVNAASGELICWLLERHTKPKEKPDELDDKERGDHPHQRSD